MKAIINKQEFDGLSDEFKAEYQLISQGEHAGSYLAKIDSVGGYSLEDVAGLKSSLSAARAERDEAMKASKAFEGLDANEVKKKLKQYEELASQDPEGKAKAQFEALKSQLTEKHERERNELQQQLEARDKEVHNLVVVSAATAALSKHGASVDLLLPHVVSRTKVTRDQNGKPVARVTGDDGQELISMKQGSTDPMDLDEFIGKVMKSDERYSRAFSGSGAAGSGSAGSDKGGGGSGAPPKFGSYAEAVARERAAKSGQL